MHRHVQKDHTQRSVRAESLIFALKVRYSRSKVKPLTHHLTPLMTVLGHHIHLVGRPRQGQDTIPVSRQGSYGVVKVQLFDPTAVIVQYFDASAVFLFPLQL